MEMYTVIFSHPEEHTLEYEHVHTMCIMHVHLMFLGRLAKDWGYGWETIRFTKDADLSHTSGRIMLGIKRLDYDIVSGCQYPVGEALVTEKTA